ncbi:MAG: Membrane-bound lytic murein transglycosylase F precursor [Bacteroidetes bacterium ADurb.Bin408]|nr:MAG: Membrane-bound lytic murein transglycosylase F precursor [Bacteroidetes bacterium ADurb.Bin408]
MDNAFYKAIYYKYFESETQVQIFRSAFCSLNSNKISVYDEALKKCCKLIGWDWRLLASLIYQESKFNTDTVSRRGAFGLMQLMPITAQRFEVDSASSPEDNIKAGVMYIRWLDKQLVNRVTDKEERQKFILAAYNIGLGHVYDAQALARKHGRNHQVWDNNVDFFLLNKSKPIYLNDTLVRNGPVKGKETYAFVRKVFERYHHYKNLIKE